MSKRDAADLKTGQIFDLLKKIGYLRSCRQLERTNGLGFDDHRNFQFESLCEKFSLEKLNPAPAAINFSKLDYFNKIL